MIHYTLHLHSTLNDSELNNNRLQIISFSLDAFGINVDDLWGLNLQLQEQTRTWNLSVPKAKHSSIHNLVWSETTVVILCDAGDNGSGSYFEFYYSIYFLLLSKEEIYYSVALHSYCLMTYLEYKMGENV